MYWFILPIFQSTIDTYHVKSPLPLLPFGDALCPGCDPCDLCAFSTVRAHRAGRGLLEILRQMWQFEQTS